MSVPLIVLALALGGQAPAPPQQTGPSPQEILKQALDTYSAAKTYQATWSYTLTRGSAKQGMEIEIKAKAPARVLFKVSAAKGPKPPADRAVPEMLVVLDGKTAWYQNTTEKVYFKLDLPKEPKYTPLMFFPQIEASSPVRRGADVQADGKTYLVVEADRAQGGTTRMEIEAISHRISRIVVSSVVAFVASVSSIVVRQETFDAEVPDKTFTYKPPRGFKEIQPPPGAGAIFGT